MNYTQFSNKQKIIEKTLIQLGILVIDKQVIKIDNLPDYDISDYRGSAFTNYYFHNSWDFNETYNSIVSAKVNEKSIFDLETIERMCREFGINYKSDNDECKYLNDAIQKDKDSFNTFGYGKNNGDFILFELRIKAIDNLGRLIYYDGSFQGNSADINPIDWGVYSVLDLIVIPKTIDNLPFYQSLLGEAYLLMIEKKYKLSYFLAYSAFESFINYELRIENDAGRLKDKLNELFTSKFPNLSTHQIYTSIINLYDSYTTERNTIAHGRKHLEVNNENLKKALLFILTLISSYKLNSSTFDDLFQKIEI